jgi:hypothetical protein
MPAVHGPFCWSEVRLAEVRSLLRKGSTFPWSGELFPEAVNVSLNRGSSFWSAENRPEVREVRPEMGAVLAEVGEVRFEMRVAPAEVGVVRAEMREVLAEVLLAPAEMREVRSEGREVRSEARNSVLKRR